VANQLLGLIHDLNIGGGGGGKKKKKIFLNFCFKKNKIKKVIWAMGIFLKKNSKNLVC